MKKFDIKKEELRGSIKQLMAVRGLRMINISNYFAWSGTSNKKLDNIHSVKIDIMNGYVDLYAKGVDCKAGKKIEDVKSDIYKKVYDTILNIFKNEYDIPSNVKRNILVKVSR